LKELPGTKCSSKIFQKFFRKLRDLDQYKYPKKHLLNFFFDFSGSLYRYQRSKIKFLFFNILNSHLVPVLNPKSTTFSHLVPVQRPQEVDEKQSKNIFFGHLYRSKYLIFGPKKLLKNFGAAFGTWYYLQKIFFKTMVVPGTKYGVFRFFFPYNVWEEIR
jgi:hypothetical protein